MGRRTGLSVRLNGFSELLEKIESAGGKAEKAAESCIRKSAEIVDASMRRELAALQSDLANRMDPPSIEVIGNATVAHVGFEKGAYDQRNLSDGYKALFLNYGTPKRKSHGQEKARNFIGKAKKASAEEVKSVQENTLKEILEGLSK